MDSRPKKPSRDLSDLKARLGLAKPGAAGQQPSQPGGTVPPAGTVPPGGTAPPTTTAPPIQPPPGAAPAPPQAGAQPTAQPAGQNPFAIAGAQPAGGGAIPGILDAGPELDIPKQKKKPIGLIIGFLVIAGAALGIGFVYGNITHSRKLFNKTIDDAARIKAEVEKMAKLNGKIAKILADTRARNKNKIIYDQKMIDELREIITTHPDANPETAKRQQEKLFRTNYAFMDDILISRLFNYYNNTLRLLQQARRFVDLAERNKELIETYTKDKAASVQRKYGIVFAEDKGAFYLGQLVEVGQPVCADKEAKPGQCKLRDITGFQVRVGASKAWGVRPGKPPRNKPQRITEIVVPIIPDENWRQVAAGSKGYLAYKQYVMTYNTVAAIAALLAKDQKPLIKELNKQAGRKKAGLLGT